MGPVTIRRCGPSRRALLALSVVLGLATSCTRSASAPTPPTAPARVPDVFVTTAGQSIGHSAQTIQLRGIGDGAVQRSIPSSLPLVAASLLPDGKIFTATSVTSCQT